MYERDDKADGNGTSFFDYVDLDRLDLRKFWHALCDTLLLSSRRMGR